MVQVLFRIQRGSPTCLGADAEWWVASPRLVFPNDLTRINCNTYQIHILRAPYPGKTLLFPWKKLHDPVVLRNVEF